MNDSNFFEYFKLNNVAMWVMRGGFEQNTTAMWVMQVFELRRGEPCCPRPQYASICKYMGVYGSLQIFWIFFDIRQCLRYIYISKTMGTVKGGKLSLPIFVWMLASRPTIRLCSIFKVRYVMDIWGNIFSHYKLINVECMFHCNIFWQCIFSDFHLKCLT